MKELFETLNKPLEGKALTQEQQDEIEVCKYGIEWIDKILELPNVDFVFGQTLKIQKEKRIIRINEINSTLQ